jgi:amino acid permease
MSNELSFFNDIDVLDGMPMRRAGAILFAIEGRTAQLVAQSRQALVPYLTEKTAAEKEQAFLAAIAQGRDLPIQPSIQNIERFAPEWATLVPSDENQRAALAKKFFEKYHFRRGDVPELRKALGLDTPVVVQAYEHLFQKSISSAYDTKIPILEKSRWLSSRFANRLERLPPFWTAFSLTLTEIIGASILALPIALAGVGPIPGMFLLFILGLVNILTIMSIVESITRNGNMRYGTTYFGRLVGDYLGKPGSAILVPVLLLFNILVLMVYYVGISTSLADLTKTSPMLWALLVFLITIYFLQRKSLNATVASALIIGFINILIIIILSGMAFPYIQPENLRYMNLPIAKGEIFNPKMLDLVFGVVLAAYFGHTTAGNAAKVVLRRDPGGGSLISGNIVAMTTAIVLYCLWVIAVNGAIPPTVLSNVTGTALSPLAAKIGGIVPVLGVIYVTLAMGMGSVHNSYGLFLQVREALPPDVKRIIQFLVSLAPIFLLFILVEWMLIVKRTSFTGLLGIVGVFLIPILGGIFPVLMLAASRRKGDYIPKPSISIMGNPLVLMIVYLLYLGSIFVYGFFIWDNPVQRAIAIGTGVMILIFTYLTFQRGAYTSRVVIELKVEELDTTERATLALVDAGKPLTGRFKLVYANEEHSSQGNEVAAASFKQLRKIFIEFSSPTSKEMKVWLHRITPLGSSEPLNATLQIDHGDAPIEAQLDPRSGQVIMPLTTQVNRLEIALDNR